MLANGVVGGLAVRGDLHPTLVQSHFLLAMVSIAFGMIAIHRSSPRIIIGSTSPLTQRLAIGLSVLTAAALMTGTVVTGTGPHAGDEDVRRFGFDISAVARVHSATVLAALALALGLAVSLRSKSPDRSRPGSPVPTVLSAWIFVGMLQAVVGYTQYFNGVPELLVGVHIALATGLWVITLWLVLSTQVRPFPIEDERKIARTDVTRV